MSTSAVKIEALVVEVSCTADVLRATLADGREVAVPLALFPRLRGATPAQRAKWRLIGGGVGVHWPDVDEDVSAAQQNSIS